ncbi:uncharacterized protein PAF06_012704 [Gastrophryne carolinensis]
MASRGASERPPAPKAELDIDLSASVPSGIPGRIKRAIRDLSDYMERRDREPLLGLEFVVEYRVSAGPNSLVDVKYYCETCDLHADLVPMIEHLSGSKHRKFYLARCYPYVLKAPPSSKEDRNQFLRRMALEIEQAEGVRQFKREPSVRYGPGAVANAKAAVSSRRSRWEADGARQARMAKALEYLETFEIDNEGEAGEVTRLTNKLTSELKNYSEKLKQQVLFPEKVARAKDVASSIMQRSAPPQSKVNPAPPARLNQDFTKNAGLLGAPPPARSQFAPPYAQPAAPASAEKNDDSEFVHKLKNLLTALPGGNPGSMDDDAAMAKKLMMLKSLLDKKTDNLPAGQQLSGADHSFNQQFNTYMANRNLMGMPMMPPPMMPPMGMPPPMIPPMGMPPAMMPPGMIPGVMPPVIPSLIPALNQKAMPVMTPAMMPPMNPAMVPPPIITKPVPDTSVAAAMVPEQSQSVSGASDAPPVTKEKQEQFLQMLTLLKSRQKELAEEPDQAPADRPYTRRALSPEGTRAEGDRFGDFDRERGPSGRRRGFDDPMQERDAMFEKRRRMDDRGDAPPRGRDDRELPPPRGMDDRGLPPSRSRGDRGYPSRGMDDRGHPPPRGRDDRGHPPPHGREEREEPPLANLSADLLKRIRGKDMFTVSAILSEYADKRK